MPTSPRLPFSTSSESPSPANNKPSSPIFYPGPTPSSRINARARSTNNPCVHSRSSPPKVALFPYREEGAEGSRLLGAIRQQNEVSAERQGRQHAGDPRRGTLPRVLPHPQTTQEKHVCLAVQNSSRSQGPRHSRVPQRCAGTDGPQDHRGHPEKIGVRASGIVSQGHVQDAHEQLQVQPEELLGFQQYSRIRGRIFETQ